MTDAQKIRRLEAKFDFLVYWGSLFHSIAEKTLDQERSKILMTVAMEKHLQEVGFKPLPKENDK